MLEPGIYFGLDYDTYRADPALSYSDIKSLLESPYNWWFYNLNPHAPEKKQTIFQLIGHATHAYLFEPDTFWNHYATEFDASQFPGALDTVNDLKGFCKEWGIKLPSNINKPVIIEHIEAAAAHLHSMGADVPLILSRLQERHEQLNAGRTLLPLDAMNGIKNAAAVLGMYKKISGYTKGGMAEVSLFWIDEATGQRMKCRLDYAKTRATVDYKTYSRGFGKSVEQAMIGSIVSGKYQLQAAMYSDGRAAVSKLIRDGKAAIVGAYDPDWLARFAAEENPTFLFIFQESHEPYEVRARAFERSEIQGGTMNEYYQYGLDLMRFGIAIFQWCSRNETWIIEDDAMPLESADFPAYAYEMPRVVQTFYRLGIELGV